MSIATGRYEANPATLADGTTKQLLLTATGALQVANVATGASASQVQGNVADDAADSGNPVKVGGVASDVALTQVTNGDRKNLWLSRNGAVMVAGVLTTATDGYSNGISLFPDGTGGVGRLTGTAGYVFNGASWDRMRGDTTGTYTVSKGTTTGGLDSARVVTGTTGVIKASAGQLYSLLSVRNANAGVRYLHLYNKATAPTLSTDTPILTISLAASSVQNAIDLTNIGAAFSAGIAWAYTTDNVAIPTTAGTSTELMFSAVYK